MDRLSIGVDLGKQSDPTAIAIADKREADTHIRHLERLPLGTPYPAVVARIKTLSDALPGSRLVVDGSGVGQAVVDSIEAEGLAPLVVTITAGKTERREGRRIWVPKATLLLPLITGIEAGTIKIAAGLPEAPALLRELKAFEVTRGERGHLGFQGKSAHDDLVLAAALALWN